MQDLRACWQLTATCARPSDARIAPPRSSLVCFCAALNVFKSRPHLRNSTGSVGVGPTTALLPAPAHVPLALPSPLLPTASVTPYFLRSSDPSANFFARPSARPFPFLLDFDLRETFFRRSNSRVLSSFFGRLQYRPSLDEFNTVRPPGDLHHNLHIFSSGFFFKLLSPYSPLQI